MVVGGTVALVGAVGGASPAPMQVALPVLIGFGTVGFGWWLRRTHAVDAEIGQVALLLAVGAGVFALLTGWLLFAFDSTLAGGRRPLLLLNGAAIGMFPHGVLGVVYLQMRDRQRALERQNRRLDEFTKIVSHDLRSPLSVATGRVELAAEDCDSPHLEQATAALRRMDRLIDETLSLARDGKTVESTGTVTVPGVVRQAWSVVDTGDDSLVVEASFTVEADEGRLERLFINLLQNAVTHNDEPVSVRVGPIESAGFYVADDGRGLPAEDPDVFDPGVTTSDDGTGYGLAIVDEIADAHGWSVAATDSAADGARFEITDVESLTVDR